MNILYIAHRIPYPPNKGDKIRSFHEVEHLSRGHTVHLAALVDNPEDLRYEGALRKYCATVHLVRINKRWAKIRSLFSLGGRSPLSLAYFFSAELKRVVDRLLAEQRFDLIFIFSSSMAQYVSGVDGTPQVIDLVDVDSDKWLQYGNHLSGLRAWMYQMEGRRLQDYETKVAARAERCILVSTKEAELFSGLLTEEASRLKISVIQNGVNLEYFCPVSYPSEEENPHTIVFTGAMDYFPNVDGVLFFYREILPLVRRQIPGVKFLIVGCDPDMKIRQLADGSSVFVTGTVADIRPYLSSAGVSVAPLRIARGIQNKILEAMAMGIPVVATSKAFEGIDAVSGKDLLIADDPSTFAQSIVEILRNPLLRSSLSMRGRERMEEAYDWDARMGDLEALLRALRE